MEVGKRAKHMGLPHPREIRKSDPQPERPTPKVTKKRKKKTFGYSYERRLWNWSKNKQDQNWKRCFVWFDTEAARDHALKVRIRFSQHDVEQDFRPECRGDLA